MFHFPMFHRPLVCMAPDTGSGSGEPTEQPAVENTPTEAQNQKEQPAEAAAQEPAPAAAQPPETPPADTERAPGTEEKTDQPDAAQQLETMKAQLGAAQLRSAAALAGVPKARIDYAVRMADVAGIDPTASDAAEKYAAAIDKVLSDVPELRGGVGTGSIGNFARKTGEPEDPDMARIKKNILG